MSLSRRASVVFLCTFAYLWWLAASRFVFVTNDEGIYLDGGLRVLHGQMPYGDFFTITGPGTFALVAASFRVFGTTVTAARMPVVLDIAMITACLFWLVCKLGDSKLSNSMAAGGLTALTYLTFATPVETAVVVNHRWDSGAWAILAGTLIIACVEHACVEHACVEHACVEHACVENAAAGNPLARRSALIGSMAGIAAGIAAWCTPTVALAIVALGACLVAYRETRRLIGAYAGGVAVAFAAGFFWITSRGALPAMIDSLVWNASNYTGANRTWYGSVTGGYANLVSGMSPADTATAIVLLAFFTLPATLPFVSAIWLWKRPSRDVVILLALGAALILSTYPRWDLNHLTWVSAPFYALVAALMARSSLLQAAVLRRVVVLTVLIAASSCLTVSVMERFGQTTRVTSLGRVHGRPEELDIMTTIQARVAPSDTLFVFPYRPLLYFVTGAHNPTRYSFLQPGMFSEKDEMEALNELRAHPPRWVIYTHVSPESYLRIWPSSDPRKLQMPAIEAFLRENYRETEQWGDLQLLEAGTLAVTR